jgi:small subunit ribosomal protein S16
MVRIRLRRVGGKNQPSFRIVAADKESPRDGRFIEILGFYNPRTEPATIQLKEDRIYDWMSKGAQPSDSAMQIFQTAGLADRYERFKGGEAVEKLMEEAEAAANARNLSTKTRHEAPVGKPGRKKEAAAQAEAEAAPGAAAEKPAEEVKEEAQPEAEEEPKAEAEAQAEEAPAAEEEESAEEEAPQAEAEEEPKAEAEAEAQAEETPAAEGEETAEEEAPQAEAEEEPKAEAEEEAEDKEETE